MRTREKKLVSIVVLSYNSDKTILATLDSINQQTYLDIELIVSDDGSVDSTIHIVRNWIASNQTRFRNCILHNQAHNVGLVRNYSSALSMCKGYWIKPIAADDLMAPNAIHEYITFASIMGSEWIFAQCISLPNSYCGSLFDLKNEEAFVVNNMSEKNIQTSSSRRLYYLLCKNNLFPAPSAFYSANFLENVGGLDLSFHHLDDLPLWLQALLLGKRPGWIDNPLVGYRKGVNSLSYSRLNQAISPLLYRDIQLVRWKYCIQSSACTGKLSILLEILATYISFRLFNNSRFVYLFLKLITFAKLFSFMEDKIFLNWL